MTADDVKWIAYLTIRQRQGAPTLRQTEVPIEHSVSLPLPTLRWKSAAYVQFAAPAYRAPDEPISQGAPDRWWALDAVSGHTSAYALCSAVPFTSTAFEPCTLSKSTLTVEQLRQLHAELDKSMDVVSPKFFTGAAGADNEKSQLRSLLETLIPKELSAQYHALAPDFFAWLFMA